ncbi:MAG: hypothetical protein KBT04_02870 [Bacteroidales bacterium]|nr:hypothetical protein [Candidatus Colimorpha onthohippi]
MKHLSPIRVRLRMARLLLVVAFLLLSMDVLGQSGIYIPSPKPVRNMQKALVNPDQFCLLIGYSGNDTVFSLSMLDLLDSVYRIAFANDNPKLYAMMIEGYGGADDALTHKRVDDVLHYFASRCHAPFPIRNAVNPIHCSCHGDTVEQVRYEVPVSLKYYNCSELPDSRLLLNKTIPLNNTVLVTFQNNPAECIGMANGCFLPSTDSLIRGYYSSLELPKGSVYAVSGTKDACPPALHIDIEEHLDYNEIVERYFLVPHPKQIIVQAGYIVLKSNFNRSFGECELELPDSIFLNIPVSEDQLEAKLKIFAKKQTEKGVEYRMLTARKIKNKATGSVSYQVALNAAMMDTIFLGKKIKLEEIKDYFYPVESDREEGTVTVKGKYYKAFVMNRKGVYESKKGLRMLIRQEVSVNEEKERESAGKPVDDEYIEDDL